MRELLANDFKTTLSDALDADAGDLALSLTDLPPSLLRGQVGRYRLLIYDAGGSFANKEIISVRSSASGANPQTIIKRGAERPYNVPLAHAAGSVVELVDSAESLRHSVGRAGIGNGMQNPWDKGLKAWSRPWTHSYAEARMDQGRIYITRIPIESLDQFPITGFKASIYRAGSGGIDGSCWGGLYDLGENDGVWTRVKQISVGTTWNSTGLKQHAWSDGAYDPGELPIWGALWLAQLFRGTTGPAPLGWLNLPSEHLGMKGSVPVGLSTNEQRALGWEDFYLTGGEPRSSLPATFTADTIAQHFTTAAGFLY